MGEARRKKLAGYVPEPREKPVARRKVVVTSSGAAMMAMAAAMLSDYPKLPKGVDRFVR